jgi:tetratricopeptide (TPR) repeat protein
MKMNDPKGWSRLILFLMPLAIFLVLAGCASFQAGSEIQSGRRALLIDNAAGALPHFEKAAELDPNYLTNFTPFREGVWTYVGRSQYASGKLVDARRNFERAISVYQDDYLAKIYLGLTLIRQQESAKGLKEFEGGMRGLHEWLEYVANYVSYGRFWDPRREIRSEIQGSLAMIGGREMNLEKVIANGEWRGKKMEEEIDLARRDEDNAYKDGEGKTDNNP